MRDLFGEIPVTISDVELWLDRIVNFQGSSLHVGYYVLNWDVVGKIAHAKLKGTWDDDVAVDDHNDLFSRVNRHTSLLDAYRLARHVAATPAAKPLSRAASMAHRLAGEPVSNDCFARMSRCDVAQLGAASQVFPAGGILNRSGDWAVSHARRL